MAARTREEGAEVARDRQAELTRQSSHGIRTLVGKVLVALQRGGRLAGDRNLDIETERLSSLIDRLSLNAALHPSIVPGRQAQAILREYLDELAHPRSQQGDQSPTDNRPAPNPLSYVTEMKVAVAAPSRWPISS